MPLMGATLPVPPDSSFIAFTTPPGVRLFGTVGEQRDATPAEVERLAASIRTTRGLKGHELLWGSLRRVRDMRFTAFAPVEYPVMCDGLWEP